MPNASFAPTDLRWGYRRWWLALLTTSALLFDFDLAGGSRLSQPDCWVAQTAREMLASGDWLVPHFAGEIRLQKTPGPYWLAAAIARLRGTDVDALCIRLPNAAAALMIVLTMTWWCRRNFGERPAIYAGFTTACSLFLLYWSHQGSSDLGVAALCTLAIAALWEADRAEREREPGASNRKSEIGNRKSLWLLFYAACGLGMLYKGPLPVGVVGFPLIAYALFWRRWRLPLQMRLPIGIPIFAALWLPWVIYIYLHLGTDALYRWRA
ncbi:MAG TPA: glycosyltransferase family 39 protein, partial [Phycisphaerae bacterium]